MEADQNKQPEEGSITQLEGSLVSIAKDELATILRYFQAYEKALQTNDKLDDELDDTLDDLRDEYAKSFVAIHTFFMLIHMRGSGLSLEGAKALGKVESDFHAAYCKYVASLTVTAH